MNTREYWDSQASAFDAEPDHGLLDATVRAAWSGVLLQLMPPGGGDVADLGCGTGSLAVLLAQAGHRVVGVDFSAEMVQAARAKAADLQVRAEFVVGDAAEPPWATGTMDRVLARHVLWAMADQVAALRSWAGLLKPGGSLILIEGLWWSGAGLSANHVIGMLEEIGRTGMVTTLDDPGLWGGPIRDERYLIVSS